MPHPTTTMDIERLAIESANQSVWKWTSDLTDAQVQPLAYLQVFSGSLSVVASVWLIYIIFALQSSESWSYTRLIFGLSVFDILSSISYIIMPFLLPAETSTRVVAHGTEGTCEIMGFVYQFSLIGACLYNAILSLFFFMVVRMEMNPNRFEKYVEPICHAVVLVYAISSAYTGLILRIYGENLVGLACWLDEYPKGCDDSEHIECIEDVIGWFMTGLPTMLTFIWIIVCNMLIYWRLRSSVEEIKKASRTTILTEERVPALARTMVARREQQVKERSEKMVAMVKQAMCYVFSFLISFGFLVASKLMLAYVDYETFKESSVFPLHVLTSLFAPLQGLFTLIVYIRPTFLQYQYDYPSETCWWCIRRALVGVSVKETSKNPPLATDSEKNETPQEPRVDVKTKTHKSLSGWSPLLFSRPFPTFASNNDGNS